MFKLRLPIRHSHRGGTMTPRTQPRALLTNIHQTLRFPLDQEFGNWQSIGVHFKRTSLWSWSRAGSWALHTSFCSREMFQRCPSTTLSVYMTPQSSPRIEQQLVVARAANFTCNEYRFKWGFWLVPDSEKSWAIVSLCCFCFTLVTGLRFRKSPRLWTFG